VGDTSCTWSYEFHNQEEDLLWTSTQVTVCVDMDSMERISIPNFLREGLENCVEGVFNE
jgi:acyl-CoA thioesterase FadM